jgi:hypothetical protein
MKNIDNYSEKGCFDLRKVLFLAAEEIGLEQRSIFPDNPTLHDAPVAPKLHLLFHRVFKFPSKQPGEKQKQLEGGVPLSAFVMWAERSGTPLRYPDNHSFTSLLNKKPL